MSFREGKYRYSLKSPGIEGDYIVKLEIFNGKTFLGLQSYDWWKNAEMRAFVPVKNTSSTLKMALQLQQEIQRMLEGQPDAEGDYVLLK